MIETVNTFAFKEEIQHTNSVPMLFTCEKNGEYFPYYIKYILDPKEFDCLVYEIVCQRLAIYFGINAPEVALVNVIEGSFKPGDLSKNTRYFRSGVIAFGSKVIENNTMLSKLDTIPDKTTFKKYSNPVDIIKIILFDLHMGNADRQEENFNILIKETIPSNLFVIDHFYCFGGATKIGVFTPAIGVYPDATIIRSDFCQQMLGYMSLANILECMDEYFYLCTSNELNAVVDEVFGAIPGSWTISKNLDTRIKAFITNQERLDQIREIITEKINIFKPL